MSSPVVLLVGLASDSVNFSKWSDLTVEKLERAFAEVKSQLEEAGFTPVWCLTDSGETSNEVLKKALIEQEPDIVSVGAGVRADPDHLRLFEQMVNTVHEFAPQAKIAFNSDPMDTIPSVQRWAI